MANRHIATYLNDHLAGAASALDLVAHLEQALAGTGTAALLGELHADIEADRQELKRLMDSLQIDQSRARQAAGWLAEKVSQLKLHFDDPLDGTLRVFEGLEAMTLGIAGKQALWRALSAAAEEAPELRVLDYQRLLQRGEDQSARAEILREAAARAALGSQERARGGKVE
jgi:hypothetical protein